MRCLHCNKMIRDDAASCPRCGKGIPRCPTCGKVVTRRVTYCPADGTELSEDILALLPDDISFSSGKRSKNSPLKDNLLAIAVLVTVVVVASFLFGGNKSEDAQDPAQMESQSYADSSGELSQGEDIFRDAETEAPEEVFTEAPTEAPTDPPTEPPTEAPTEAPKTALDYWIQNCDSVKFSSEDLKSFNKEECRLARNAIFAKSGRKFNDKELQRYFEAYDWYDPSVDPDDFQNSMLNSTQSHNLELILDFEQRKGYR